MRRHVAAVGEGVDPRALGHPLAPGELEQGAQVIDVGVDAAVGDEPEQVHVAVALARAPKRADQRLVRRRTSRRRPTASRARDPGAGSAPSRSSGDRPRSSPSGRRAGRRPRRRPRAACAGSAPRARRRRASPPARPRFRAGRGQTPAVEDHERDEIYGRGAANRGERVGIEGGAADERPVDAGLREQLGGVVGLDRAAVQDARRCSSLIRACASRASSGVAVLPVPIAQTGS